MDVIAERDVPTSAIDFHVSNIVEELMQQDKVRAALLRAVERAPTLGDDLGETLRSCIWTHCSSVTDKSTFALGKRRTSARDADAERVRVRAQRSVGGDRGTRGELPEEADQEAVLLSRDSRL